MKAGIAWAPIILGVAAQAYVWAVLEHAGNANAVTSADFVGALFWVAIIWCIVYWMARWKNREPGTWLALTFLIGFFTVPILLFVPRDKFMPGETQQCPHCLSEIPIAASVCRYCQRDVPSAIATNAATQ